MQCPKCKEDDNFVRRTHDNFMTEQIPRTRFCKNCGYEFHTEEKATRFNPPSSRRGYGKITRK